MVEYKFREDELIDEFKAYIDKTYDGHYNTGSIQSSEVIVDREHGQGFFHGNIDKYNGRYGKKGDTPAEWRKDIVKIIHYGFLALYEHDRKHSVTDEIQIDGEVTITMANSVNTVTLPDYGRAPNIELYNSDDLMYNIKSNTQ